MCFRALWYPFEDGDFSNDHRQVGLVLQLCRWKIWCVPLMEVRREHAGFIWTTLFFTSKAPTRIGSAWFYILWSFYRIILQSHISIELGWSCDKEVGERGQGNMGGRLGFWGEAHLTDRVTSTIDWTFTMILLEI
jgi:hypothetical protein